MLVTFLELTTENVSTTVGYGKDLIGNLLPILLPLIGILIGLLIFRMVIGAFR